MKTNRQHKTQVSDNDFIKSLPELELSYSKSKEEVWNSLSAIINKENSQLEDNLSPIHSIRDLKFTYAVAAVFITLLVSTAFMRFYTKTINVGTGEHISALLPDKSSIELNASSTIQYHPYWWQFNRQVQFEGEGFFKVQKGSTFEVISTKGKTIVLGTSFNIYSRKDDYAVTCYTGKVKVVSNKSGQSVSITPNKQAIIKNNGSIISRDDINTDNTIAWRDGMFIFTATPINQVFEEIERQYGVSINLSTEINYNYTGNFTRQQSVDDVMHTVCLALNISYQQVKGGYKVSKY
nr:FecR family protein [uncultured Carboxylicivirga sp.]